MKGFIAHYFPRYFLVLFLGLALWHGAVDYSPALAGGKSELKGRVSDVEDRPVEGARVFIYSSPDVRRPADFISDSTDKDGLFRVVLPPGKYWPVARLKKTEGFGPLMPGDKHSGQPGEIELAPDSEVSMDFVVADLKDAIKVKRKAREGPVRISGRIIDEDGLPVTTAYAFANRNEKVDEIPDYISAWVDSEGRYTLYVPRGKYYLGGAVTFPPAQSYFMQGEINIDDDRSGVDMVRRSAGTK